MKRKSCNRIGTKKATLRENHYTVGMDAELILREGICYHALCVKVCPNDDLKPTSSNIFLIKLVSMTHTTKIANIKFTKNVLFN